MENTLTKKLLLLAAISMALISFKHPINSIEERGFKTNSLIDKLTNLDTLKISREINGCEIHSMETIKIYKRSDTLFATLTINLNDGLTYPNLITSLTDKSILAYAEFEKELKKHSTISRGCTSTADYCIRLGSDTIKLKDWACKFHGDEVLKEQLFGQAAIENYNKSIHH